MAPVRGQEARVLAGMREAQQGAVFTGRGPLVAAGGDWWEAAGRLLASGALLLPRRVLGHKGPPSQLTPARGCLGGEPGATTVWCLIHPDRRCLVMNRLPKTYFCPLLAVKTRP